MEGGVYFKEEEGQRRGGADVKRWNDVQGEALPFTEGVFESLSEELLRGGTHRKDVVGVFCRPPGRDKGGFSHEMAKVIE